MRWLACISVLIALLSIHGQDIEISIATTDQLNPCVAYNESGGGYMVMWEDNRAGSVNKNIFAQPINNDGSVPMVILPVCVLSGNQENPEIAGLGSEFLTLWQEAGSYISGRTSTIDALGDGPFEAVDLSSEAEEIDITAGEDRYFAVWREGDVIKGVALDEEGSPMTTPFAIHSSSYAQGKPTVAFYDGLFVVAYRESRGTGSVIVVKYIYSDGTTHAGPFDIAEGTIDPNNPEIESNGTVVMCVFSADNPSTGDSDILGQIVTPDAMGDPFDVLAVSGQQTNPDIATNGDAFLVVFEDFGDGYFADIKGQWISVSGTLLEDLYVISAEMAAQGDPRIAYGDGNFLCVWEDRRRGGSDIFGRIVEEITISSGPSASVVAPARNSYTSCDFQDIRILITDDDGVNQETVELEVNGVLYSYPSTEISFSGDTLIYTPPVAWEDEEAVNYRLLAADDITGAPLSGTINVTFNVDLTAPRFEGPSPANGATVPDLPSMISINAFDDGAGIDETTLTLSWGELELSYPDPALYWNGITFALFVDSLAAPPVMPENTLCISALDMPDVCEPNYYEFCWTFTNTSDIYEWKPIEHSIEGAYPNPFNSAVEISHPQFNGEGRTLIITDMEGRNVGEINSNKGIWKWKPESMESGMYFYSISDSNVKGKLLYAK